MAIGIGIKTGIAWIRSLFASWKVEGMLITSTPNAPSPATLTTDGYTVTAVSGGTYEFKNTTTSTSTEVTMAGGEQRDRRSYGSPGEFVDVRGLGFSSFSPEVTAPTAPAAITDLAVTKGDTTNTLIFSAPASSSPITDYVYEFSLDGLTGWTTITDGVSATVGYIHTGLTNGTEYFYRVSAVSANGTGDPSNIASGIPQASANATVASAGRFSSSSSASSYTFSITTSASFVVIAVSARNTSSVTAQPSSVTIGGNAMTARGTSSTASGTTNRISLYSISGLAPGTYDVVITFANAQLSCGGQHWAVSTAFTGAPANTGASAAGTITQAVTAGGVRIIATMQAGNDLAFTAGVTTVNRTNNSAGASNYMSGGWTAISADDAAHAMTFTTASSVAARTIFIPKA